LVVEEEGCLKPALNAAFRRRKRKRERLTSLSEDANVRFVAEEAVCELELE